MRILLDSCIAVYEVEAKAPWCASVHSAIGTHHLDEFCYSDLTRLECRLGPLKAGDLAGAANFDRFFGRNTKLELTTAVYDLATDLRARHGLKTPDAIHLATALSHGCAEFWTNDLRLARATGTLALRTF